SLGQRPLPVLAAPRVAPVVERGVPREDVSPGAERAVAAEGAHIAPQALAEGGKDLLRVLLVAVDRDQESEDLRSEAADRERRRPFVIPLCEVASDLALQLLMLVLGHRCPTTLHAAALNASPRRAQRSLRSRLT